jgi:enamine deaminase RidA (YjgF/YER057c/UK114 family)
LLSIEKDLSIYVLKGLSRLLQKKNLLYGAIFLKIDVFLSTDGHQYKINQIQFDFVFKFPKKGEPVGIEQKLKELEIILPQSPKPMANYVPVARTGNLLFVSGHGPYNDGKTKISGKIGQELTLEEGYQTARNVALNCLASVQAAVGSLDKIKRVVKVLGMVNCTEDFKDQPKVINGCSDLLVSIFGEAGKHARSAVGVQALPNQIPVEIEMILEIA